MFDFINEKAPHLKEKLEGYRKMLVPLTCPAKTVLLREGEISRRAYFIDKGCLRTWFNHDGKEITFQFFFEGQGVSSFESFWTQQPSLYYIETIEPCVLQYIQKKDYETIIANVPEIKDVVLQTTFQRMTDYQKLFLSRIRDNPQKRYAALLHDHPQIVQRVPQHYIASYLGITPVSLSRLRSKI
jgi:CRP-like cAMP-binding protein